MATKIITLTDGVLTNNLIEFVSTYFPFIDEPLKMTYRGRTYKVITTQAREFEFEDFFISHQCLKCPVNCCKNMYIPIGFAEYWSEEKVKSFRSMKPKKYHLLINGREMGYYIGLTTRGCKHQKGKVCTVWDSNLPVQRRPMGCHLYPMTWYWDAPKIIFTKYCDPYLCKAESMLYTEADFQRDLNTFEKMAQEVEAIGLAVNYRPIAALKEQCYFSL